MDLTLKRTGPQLTTDGGDVAVVTGVTADGGVRIVALAVEFFGVVAETGDVRREAVVMFVPLPPLMCVLFL